MSEKQYRQYASSWEAPRKTLPLFPSKTKSPLPVLEPGPPEENIPNDFLLLGRSVIARIPKYPTAKAVAPHELVPKGFLSLGSVASVPVGWNELRLRALYDASPKIEKRLTPSDVGNNHNLILSAEDVEEKFLSIMDNAMADLCSGSAGVRFQVLDLDDNSPNSLELILKKHGSFVLVGNWKSNFVVRKNLKARDVVGVALAHGFLIFKIVSRSI